MAPQVASTPMTDLQGAPKRSRQHLGVYPVSSFIAAALGSRALVLSAFCRPSLTVPHPPAALHGAGRSGTTCQRSMVWADTGACARTRARTHACAHALALALAHASPPPQARAQTQLTWRAHVHVASLADTPHAHVRGRVQLTGHLFAMELLFAGASGAGAAEADAAVVEGGAGGAVGRAVGRAAGRAAAPGGPTGSS